MNLLTAAFHEGPVFRMGFDAHVRAWTKWTQRACWVRYHTDPTFAAAYDERRAEVRQIATAAINSDRKAA